MTADIIQLLPDNIANQIAAGEVIQRPASVVKELIENAIDAGAIQVKIIIKDAGKTLIQVIDDGVGMSETDARMSFERHATSKIRKTDDLFNITTKGFRGEALASIASIAQVELITRQATNELATRILIAGNKIEKQEAAQAPVGTNFLVKNLFFNVPARRKFLKSDAVEFRHLLEEIHRVAIAHHDVAFNVWHNDNEVYKLPATSLAQRIIAVFGKAYTDKLLPVGEESEFVKIDGFILKSEAAKRSAGDQYFFVNKRFIKSPYLNHAVKMGFEQLLQPDQYAGYFIFIEVDPHTIDVNVHPTKTEIKFDEEKLIYNFLRVCVRHSLGKFMVAPTLDFDSSPNITTDKESEVRFISHEKDLSNLEKENLSAWQSIYDNIKADATPKIDVIQSEILDTDLGKESSVNPVYSSKDPFQLHNSYIISQVKNGYVIVDQQYAHERILFEDNLRSLQGSRRDIQKELFPHSIHLNPSQAVLLKSIMHKLNKMGFDIGEFGNNTFIIHGIPAGLPSSANAIKMIQEILQNYAENTELQLGIDINLARSYAKCTAIPKGRALAIEEMKDLIDKLFACETPFTSPSGHKTFIKQELEELRKLFL
jgi:DNA mismatch repair protein MutL